MKENSKLNIIKYGELHTYYPLKFDTGLSFEDLCKTISQSSIIFKNEYQEKIMNSLGASLAQTTESFNQSHSEDLLFHAKMDDFEKYKSMSSDSINTAEQEIRIELDATDSSVKLSFVSIELETLENRLQRLYEEYDYSKKYYGNFFVDSHERFLLLPLKVKLQNGESVWLSALLYLFTNRMGILKLELPLVNSESIPLMENCVDDFIKEITCSWNNEFSSENSLESISHFYIDTLFRDTNVNLWKYNNEICHTILVDFDAIPVSCNTLPNTLQEDLFRIISAPVPNRPCTSFLKDAQDYLKKYSWGGHNMKYIVKTTGGCLSFVDQQLLDFLSNNLKESLNINTLDNSDYAYLCNILVRDLCLNAELALIIVILKKINNHNTIIQKLNSPVSLSKIQNEYWENIRFICGLQENCYGTVSEQITDFEKMMSHYLKPEITSEKLTAIDNILKEQQLEKDNSFQNFVSIGGLLLAIFFGLPSIYETLGILRTFCSFFPDNIPYISHTNASIFLWLILNIFIILRLFIKK